MIYNKRRESSMQDKPLGWTSGRIRWSRWLFCLFAWGTVRKRFCRRPCHSHKACDNEMEIEAFGWAQCGLLLYSHLSSSRYSTLWMNGSGIVFTTMEWCRESLLHLARGGGVDDGHVDGILAVDVDVNPVDADSSRRCNNVPTANWQRI